MSYPHPKLCEICDRTIALVVRGSTILLLVVLVEALLSAVLRVVSLLVVLLLLLLLLLLLVLRRVSELLTRLEGLGAGLERGDGRSEASLALSLGGVLGVVEVQLLLSLTGEVVILSGRIVLPRVEVGHDDL